MFKPFTLVFSTLEKVKRGQGELFEVNSFQREKERETRETYKGADEKKGRID